MARKTPTTSKHADWRDNILSALPDAPMHVRANTFESAWEQIKVAAYNRRMTPEDFMGRAALAFAVYDNGDTWENATQQEPVMRDLRRRGLPPLRLRGRGFGPWRIENLSE